MTTCPLIQHRADVDEIWVCRKQNLRKVNSTRQNETSQQGCQVGLTNHPQKIPKYRFSKYPNSPYIGDMKRRSKLFKTLSTHIYFEKAENTLKLCFYRAVNQDAENKMYFKEQLVVGQIKKNIFNKKSRTCNKAQNFNILAEQILKKFEIP